MIELVTKIRKRDGQVLDFNADKISRAITKAAESVAPLAPNDTLEIDALTETVIAKIKDRYPDDVEISEIQNVVEQTLITAGHYQWAQHYTDYRLHKDLERRQRQDVNYNARSCLIGTKQWSTRTPTRTVGSSQRSETSLPVP